MYVFLNTDQLGSLRKSGKVKFPGRENGKCPCVLCLSSEVRNEAQSHETIQRVRGPLSEEANKYT